MNKSTDRTVELKSEIAELQSQIADAGDIGHVGRLRSILTAKRDELRRLRRRAGR